MIKPIPAKVMISHIKQPDTWFGLKYNMNLYRGCQHQCIYCDSRSECYQIENFSIIACFRFPVHVITKGDLVLRDLDLLLRISEIYAAVSFTITTTDDELAKKLEPGAPPPSARLQAMKILADNGILTGVTMMPILPFIQDNEENITQIVTQAHAHGTSYVLPSFGVTLRDRQRAYFYEKLDRHFPGLRGRYDRKFGSQIFAPANN